MLAGEPDPDGTSAHPVSSAETGGKIESGSTVKTEDRKCL